MDHKQCPPLLARLTDHETMRCKLGSGMRITLIYWTNNCYVTSNTQYEVAQFDSATLRVPLNAYVFSDLLPCST
eukprot:1141048-Amphidinium_carterae.1